MSDEEGSSTLVVHFSIACSSLSNPSPLTASAYFSLLTIFTNYLLANAVKFVQLQIDFK